MRLHGVCAVAAGLALGFSSTVTIAGPWYELAVLDYFPETNPPGTFGDLIPGNGKSVTIYGDRIAVGSPNAELYDGVGYVYVYSRSSSGQWSQTLTLNAGADRPYFGRSVALSEEYLAVGDAFHTTALNGRVTMYRINENTSDYVEMFLPGGVLIIPQNSEYGTSVDLAGTTLVAGYFERNGALVYEQEVLLEDPFVEQWPATQVLQKGGNSRGSRFGTVVATSGDALAIAEKPNFLANDLSGTVHLSDKTATGEWSAPISLAAPTPIDNDNFGGSLSMDGDYLVVGAFGHSPRGDGKGAVYIYERIGVGEWGLIADLIPSDIDQVGFGTSVAISGERVIIGAASSVYIFERDSTGDWLEIQKINDPTSNDIIFGREVDIHGDTAVVLANQHLYVYAVPEPSACIILLVGTLARTLSRQRQPSVNRFI